MNLRDRLQHALSALALVALSASCVLTPEPGESASAAPPPAVGLHGPRYKGLGVDPNGDAPASAGAPAGDGAAPGDATVVDPHCGRSRSAGATADDSSDRGAGLDPNGSR